MVRERLTPDVPAVAIILGSGLGNAVERLSNGRSLRYEEIPGFSGTAVEGHAGHLHVGTLGGREVLVLAGRSWWKSRPLEAGATTVSSIIASGILPAALEMMDRLCRSDRTMPARARIPRCADMGFCGTSS